jgi:putative transposase
LAEIGKRLGRKALKRVARMAKPDSILAWYRRLIAQKFDGSKHRSYPGRPRIGREVTDLIVRMARENSGWGYDRIVGRLSGFRTRARWRQPVRLYSEVPSRRPWSVLTVSLPNSGT